MGATHGVILTAWAIDAVAGGLIFSAVYNKQKKLHPEDSMRWYDLNFRWILAPVLLSFLVCLFIPTHLRDRKLPKAAGEVLRFRFVDGRLVRLVRWKPVWLSKEEEKVEWAAYLQSLAPQPTATSTMVDGKGDPLVDSHQVVSQSPDLPSALTKEKTQSVD